MIPLGTEQEPSMSLQSVKAQCESPELEALEEQGNKRRPILRGKGR